jgi:hypothetical protein
MLAIPATWEAEAEGLQIPGQSPKKKSNNKKEGDTAR